MFFYDPKDPDNCVAIKPLNPPELKIIKVIDDNCAIVSKIVTASEQYTYVASLKGNDSTQLRWCFWIDKQDKHFEKDYTIRIKSTEEKTESENDFFLSSKAEREMDKKKENTEALKQNAILSATVTTEVHDINGKQKEVAVLKVKFSKWLDGECLQMEVYKYNEKDKKGNPTRNSSKKSVCNRAVTIESDYESKNEFWMTAIRLPKLEEELTDILVYDVTFSIINPLNSCNTVQEIKVDDKVIMYERKSMQEGSKKKANAFKQGKSYKMDFYMGYPNDDDRYLKLRSGQGTATAALIHPSIGSRGLIGCKSLLYVSDVLIGDDKDSISPVDGNSRYDNNFKPQKAEYRDSSKVFEAIYEEFEKSKSKYFNLLIK